MAKEEEEEEEEACTHAHALMSEPWNAMQCAKNQTIARPWTRRLRAPVMAHGRVWCGSDVKQCEPGQSGTQDPATENHARQGRQQMSHEAMCRGGREPGRKKEDGCGKCGSMEDEEDGACLLAYLTCVLLPVLCRLFLLLV